mmetsp:Transcript_67308/g.158640  ORF Transcript_67308/g.158640 Transcript_67308/m.158640 type:complete len:230 (+) Transcript_67308:184-873(+)
MASGMGFGQSSATPLGQSTDLVLVPSPQVVEHSVQFPRIQVQPKIAQPRLLSAVAATSFPSACDEVPTAEALSLDMFSELFMSDSVIMLSFISNVSFIVSFISSSSESPLLMPDWFICEAVIVSFHAEALICRMFSDWFMASTELFKSSVSGLATSVILLWFDMDPFAMPGFSMSSWSSMSLTLLALEVLSSSSSSIGVSDSASRAGRLKFAMSTSTSSVLQISWTLIM